MWPFKRRKPKIARPRSAVRRVVAGLIIGGAVASIVGKRVVDRAHKEHEEKQKPSKDTKSDN